MALDPVRLLAFVDGLLRSGDFSVEIAVTIAGVTGLGPTDLYRRLKVAFLAYQAGMRVTPSALQTRTVKLAPRPPPVVEAPILGDAAAQAVADSAAAARNQRNVDAAAAAAPYDFRPLACMNVDPDASRGLDAMVEEVCGYLPALDLLKTAQGAPAKGRWGDGLAAGVPVADEAEFRAAVRQVLMACTSAGNQRVAGWQKQLSEAKAAGVAVRAAYDQQVKDDKAARAVWRDEDVLKLVEDFENDPDYMGWKIPMYHLLRRNDVSHLAAVVSQKRLPISGLRGPTKTKAFAVLGTGAPITYKERRVVTAADGVGHWEDDDDDSFSNAGVLDYYSQVRNWLYTVMALARGLRAAPEGPRAGAAAPLGALWVTPPGILAYLEMLLTVSGSAGMTPAAYVEFGEHALQSVVTDVNAQGGTLDSALLREVASMGACLRTVHQQKALLGTHALGGASAQSSPLASISCKACPSKDVKIRDLTAKVNELTNLDKNKKALLDRYAAAHGPPPGAPAPAASGGAASGPSTPGARKVSFKPRGSPKKKK